MTFRKYLRSFLLIFFLISNFILAQNIQLQFSKNENKKVQEIIPHFQKILNSKLEIDSIIKFINEGLNSKGFVEHELIIDSIFFSNSFEILISIDTKKQFVIESIEINDTLLNNNSNFQKINLLFKGQPLANETIMKIGELLIESYESTGYPFAVAIFNGYSVLNEDENVKYCMINFNIDKGPIARIDRIKIIGNKFTQTNVIRRELRLKNEEIFTPQLALKIQTRIKRLNIFDDVKLPGFYFDDKGNGILELEVKEKNTNSFDGILGYIPSKVSSRKGYITGMVNISLRNLFGTLRAFAFRWNRLNESSQDFEIKYFEPWFLGYPINLQPSFFQLKQDSSFIRRNFNFPIDLNLTENFALIISYSTERVIPLINVNTQLIPKSASNSIGFGLLYDTRDNPFFAKNGFYFRTEINRIFKNEIYLNRNEKIFQKKASVNFNYYQPTLKNQILYLSLNGKVLIGDRISLSDLFFLGGINSVRGYSENQFWGNKIFWSNIEYRYITGISDYIAIFFDLGYYSRGVLNEKISNYKFGYGIGLAFNTQLGLLRVNYALGKGDSFTEGKIHFGISSLF